MTNLLKWNKHLKTLIFVLSDVFMLLVAFELSYLLSGLGTNCFTQYVYLFLADIPIMLMAFSLSKMYRMVWRYAGFKELVHVAFGVAVVCAVNLVVAIPSPDINPRWALIFSIIFFTLISITRFSYRLYFRVFFHDHNKKKRVLIVGAGDAGVTLITELQNSKLVDKVAVCIVDDDINKVGGYIAGVKIAGDVSYIPTAVKSYNIDEIIIAIPSVDKKRKAQIINICKDTGVKTMIIPGIYQFVNGEAMLEKIRDVNIADLLGRDQINVNLDEILGYIKNKVVLVTGGGGSIGSELCKQIATNNPKQLIIFDIYENNAYEIEQEIKRKLPNLNLVTLIGSVRDLGRMESLFETYKPEIVFHAAAHKHVPLMEQSPNEAIKNNVLGTYNTAKCADKYGVKRFVLISTDKAVNPTSLMGATKRICEMIIQTFGKRSKTEFVAVRFGNVLGSNGSVIPLFKKQIQEGGPVTVTHKDIVRYFITIPEAVSLVLQAGAYAKGGEIFVLEMGEPVKIYDLAYNLIKLSGLEPNVDINIVCTGLRPGEKLYEERLMAEEGLQHTDNNLISIGKPISFDEDNLFSEIDKLVKLAYGETGNREMKEAVEKLVPTYHITDNK